ncbi:MAG: sporulation initiation factor Spo0A C-terminal domain-containing protein [Waltera sp.]
MEVVSSVTQLLYPTIAKHFKTTDQKVERAIRNCH